MIETRRKFLIPSSAFATFAISGTKSSGKIIGANDRLHIAIAGLGRRLGAFLDPISNKKSNARLKEFIFLEAVMLIFTKREKN